jgi:hypothetical protein
MRARFRNRLNDAGAFDLLALAQFFFKRLEAVSRHRDLVHSVVRPLLIQSLVHRLLVLFRIRQKPFPVGFVRQKPF